MPKHRRRISCVGRSIAISHPIADPNAPTTGASFDQLDLSDNLLRTLHNEGYHTPTPIQLQAIPPVLEGHDLLGIAQTGTGKTAAFALPVIDILQTSGVSNRGRRSPRALVLAPTRELASQIAESMSVYGRGTRLRAAVLFGGVKQFRQVKQLEKGVDVIIATPGRLQDLMQQGFVDLSEIDVFVLDEADRMLDMGFVKPIREIASQLPEDRQTLLFSATMPDDIAKLAESLLTDPVRVSVTPVASAAPLIDQSVYLVGGADKPVLLTHLLKDDRVERAVVFTRTKHGADKLLKRLSREGISAEAIHGNKSQGQRDRALDAFRKGQSRVLVATDVAARGLDVDGVTHVFNFNVPNEPDAYVHRIGRTGRAGETGHAVTLCSREEAHFLQAIERLLDDQIDALPWPDGLTGGTKDKPIEKAVAQPRRARAGGGQGQGQGQRQGRGTRSRSAAGKPSRGRGGKPSSRRGPNSRSEAQSSGRNQSRGKKKPAGAANAKRRSPRKNRSA